MTRSILARLVPALAIVPLLTAPALAQDQSPPQHGNQRYLRVSEDGKRVALEVAIRQFEPIEGDGPRIGLVGVAHVGEASFYDALQNHLDAYDRVLFESVLPAGARAGGETDGQRARSTEQALEFVARIAEAHRAERLLYPEDVDGLRDWARALDPRLRMWVAVPPLDGWGNPIEYERHGIDRITLRSHGRDGAEGGEGHDADVTLEVPPRVEAERRAESGGMQVELAHALGMTFQLDEIDYDRKGWLCSDMAMDQVNAALEYRGVRAEILQESMAGVTLPTRMARILLQVLKFADLIFGGAIVDSAKVMMIEMLGDEELMDQSLNQMGDGFSEVIIDLRNQIVVDDLALLLAREGDDVETVGIFYGAAHMPDLADRLREQLGYVPVEDPAAVEWYSAMEVDLAKSAASGADLERMRGMMKRMMGR